MFLEPNFNVFGSRILMFLEPNFNVFGSRILIFGTEFLFLEAEI